jgi:hypothetical protein
MLVYLWLEPTSRKEHLVRPAFLTESPLSGLKGLDGVCHEMRP